MAPISPFCSPIEPLRWPSAYPQHSPFFSPLSDPYPTAAVQVVATHIEVGMRHRGKDAVQVYQMVQTSQIMQYGSDEFPEARFTYDTAPMAVVIKVWLLDSSPDY